MKTLFYYYYYFTKKASPFRGNARLKKKKTKEKEYELGIKDVYENQYARNFQNQLFSKQTM